MATAWQKVGHDIPDAPKSGLGKDPRKDFEDEHWTEEQKAGHRAYVDAVQKGQVKTTRTSASSEKIVKLAEQWDEKIAADLEKEVFTPVAHVRDTATSERVNELTKKLTNGDKESQELGRVKPTENFPKGPSVAELAKFLATKPQTDKQLSAQNHKREQNPGVVQDKAKLWTDMKRKDSSPSGNDELASLKPPKGVVSDRLKSFDAEGSAVEAPKESVEEEQDRALTKYQSIMDRHQKLQERKKNRPKIETNDALNEEAIERMHSLREELGPTQIPAPKGVVSDQLKSFDVEGSAVEAPKESVEEEQEPDRVLTRYQSIMDRHQKLQEKKKNRPKIIETNDALNEEAIERMHSLWEELGPTQIPDAEAKTAEAPATQEKLTHLTANRARPPKKNRITNA